MGSSGESTSKLTVNDLLSLEEYHGSRDEFRARVLAHKKNRQIAVGEIVTLYFEDRLTMQYQVQEMLRIERIFETEAIEEELAAYNPLIPDGSNLKATFMIEIPDAEERKDRLYRLAGIEACLYAKVDDSTPIRAIADEDLDRTTPEKTSAVHFVRIEFDAEARAALECGAALKFGVNHPEYMREVELNSAQRTALLADFAETD
jgi:hypothetical protein